MSVSMIRMTKPGSQPAPGAGWEAPRLPWCMHLTSKLPNKKAIAKQEKLAKCYWVRHTDDGEVRCEQATLAELNGLIEEREHPPQAKKRKDVGTEDDVYKDDIEDAATKENANPNVKGTSKPGRATGKQNKIRAALEAKASKKARK
ncbi:hypothetical protein WJX79_001164 [Trebouxia sp. C0005]